MAVKIYNVINKGVRISDGVFTGPSLITDAGLYIESAGGYYAGGNILVDGTEYKVIVAPKELGEAVSTEWKVNNTTSGTFSKYDGKSNMQTIINSGGITSHPAFNFCNNLNINGFSDWHLPSPDELELCYRFLKPNTIDNYVSSRPLHNETNGFNPNSNPLGGGYTVSSPTLTVASEFQSGNAQAFIGGAYWTSYEPDSVSTAAYYQRFSDGLQNTTLKDGNYYVRAVRWVEV